MGWRENRWSGKASVRSNICAENKAEQDAMNTSGREVDSGEEYSRERDIQMQGRVLRQRHDWEEEEPGGWCVGCGGGRKNPTGAGT